MKVIAIRVSNLGPQSNMTDEEVSHSHSFQWISAIYSCRFCQLLKEKYRNKKPIVFIIGMPWS